MKFRHLNPLINSPLKGFTMVELLIVVAIISILTTISASVYGGISKNNRDKQRLTDLTSIKQALELYRTEQFRYPSDTQFVTGTIAVGGKVYLDVIPEDLSYPDRLYAYRALPLMCTGASCTGYVLCAKKEGNMTYRVPSECSQALCEPSGIGTCDIGLSSD